MTIQFPRTQIDEQDNSNTAIISMIENDRRLHEKPGPFEWWYRLTAPIEPPLTADLEERERARQGRLMSSVLALVAGSLIILAIPTSFLTHNPVLLGVLCVLLTIISVALFLNKRGKSFLGGLMVVIAMNLSLIFAILSWTGGLTTNTLPLLDIVVVEPILVAFAILPLRGVFILAGINAVVIGAIFMFEPRSVDLSQVMAFDGYEVITRPLYLLVFVLGVLTPQVLSAKRAIVRGDRATVIASVEHHLAEQGKAVTEQKRLLDKSVDQIVEVHRRVANGDLAARVPLTSNNVLWQVAGSLNNLLSRFQRARQAEQELERCKVAAAYYVRAVQQAKGGFISWQRTGTPIDEIVMEHNAQVQVSSSLNKPFHFPQQ